MSYFEGGLQACINFMVNKVNWKDGRRWIILYDAVRERYRVASEQVAVSLCAGRTKDRFTIIINLKREELLKVKNMRYEQTGMGF